MKIKKYADYQITDDDYLAFLNRNLLDCVLVDCNSYEKDSLLIGKYGIIMAPLNTVIDAINNKNLEKDSFYNSFSELIPNFYVKAELITDIEILKKYQTTYIIKLYFNAFGKEEEHTFSCVIGDYKKFLSNIENIFGPEYALKISLDQVNS